MVSTALREGDLKLFTSYKDETLSRISAIHQRGIALKILEHMDRVRNNSSIDLARRWPQELLQNATDACGGNRKVKVKIHYDGNKVVFMHNGDPFKLEHIISLINQVSSKKRENTEAIGRFGTGFMSTFQLSEMVEVESIIEDGGLSPKRIHVMLDRRGRSHEDITESIKSSMDQLIEADEGENYNYDPDEYNTKFIYHID